MEVNKPPKGLIVDLVTPLDDNGGIDSRSLGSLVNRVLPYSDGIALASPQMGEGRGLEAGMKGELLKRAISFIQGRMPIFFWVSGDFVESTGETIDFLEDILKSTNYNGAVFWLDSPLVYHSNRGLLRYYENLSAKVCRSFALYNDPALVKSLGKPLKRTNIRTSIIKSLSMIEGIVGLVFRGSLSRANNYQKAVNRRPDFRLYDGDEIRFLHHPSLSGILSSGANLAPELWSTVTRASLGMLRQDREKADYLEKIWGAGNFLKTLIQMYEKNPVRMIKKALFDLRIIDSPAVTRLTDPFIENTDSLAEFILGHNIK